MPERQGGAVMGPSGHRRRLSRVRLGSGPVAILSRFAEIAGSLSAPVAYHYRLWFASL